MGHAGISPLKEKAANDAIRKGMVVAAWMEWLREPPEGR